MYIAGKCIVEREVSMSGWSKMCASNSGKSLWKNALVNCSALTNLNLLKLIKIKLTKL